MIQAVIDKTNIKYKIIFYRYIGCALIVLRVFIYIYFKLGTYMIWPEHYIVNIGGLWKSDSNARKYVDQ